jgi:putative transposase
MPEKDAFIESAIRESLGKSRKGRHKTILLVKKKHPELGASRIRRVYQKNGYSLTKKMNRRVKQNVANPIFIPVQKNEEWAIDFMSDSLENGRRFRTLNVIDHYNRQCMGVEISFNFPARSVTEYLDRLFEAHGKPQRIRTDNGPEFRSKWFQIWLKNNGVAWSPIENGKPQQNAIVERFNRTFREDVLDANVFQSIEHVKRIKEDWLNDYNLVRPHESLNYQSPLTYAA